MNRISAASNARSLSSRLKLGVPVLLSILAFAGVASADEPGLTAAPAPITAPGHIVEEMPTQRIPRVEVPTQQLSRNEMADQATADHPAVVEEIPTQRIPRV